MTRRGAAKSAAGARQGFSLLTKTAFRKIPLIPLLRKAFPFAARHPPRPSNPIQRGQPMAGGAGTFSRTEGKSGTEASEWTKGPWARFKIKSPEKFRKMLYSINGTGRW